MTTQITLTDLEQTIIDVIKGSDNDNNGYPYEYLSNLITYSNLSSSEVVLVLSSLEYKKAIVVMYDYRGKEVYMLN